MNFQRKKSRVYKTVYWLYGIKSCCLAVSNLGVVQIPKEMQPYVSAIHFIQDANPKSTNSCAVLSFNDELHINFCRSIRETELERRFCVELKNLGLEPL